MSIEFMSLNEEYRKMYEENINQMLKAIAEDNRFEEQIRNLCNTALNWSLEKKVNVLNIVTNN
jgi:uncharacterized protein YihD (DUF1040 family)